MDEEALRALAEAASNGDDIAYDILSDGLWSGSVVLELLDRVKALEDIEQEHRALLVNEQNLREELAAWRVTAENAEAAVKQARIDALEAARDAVSAEEILEAEDNSDDAYNCGVLDCVRAVEKLKGKTP